MDVELCSRRAQGDDARPAALTMRLGRFAFIWATVWSRRLYTSIGDSGHRMLRAPSSPFDALSNGQVIQGGCKLLKTPAMNHQHISFGNASSLHVQIEHIVGLRRVFWVVRKCDFAASHSRLVSIVAVLRWLGGRELDRRMMRKIDKLKIEPVRAKWSLRNG
jgi:hypothetical protein